MSWFLRNEDDVDVPGVVSFRMEQSKGKPATLSWELPVSQASYSSFVSLWRGDECLFKGRVYKRPTHINDGYSTWSAIAIDDTFQAQRSKLLLELNQDAKLSGNLKDCEGAKAGYLHIDRVTHSVSWVSLDQAPLVWDMQEIHERDSLYITPFDQALTGVCASVKLQTKRLESGMMEVGTHIVSRLPNGVQTYSGAALEDQWTKLAFKAVRAGYDIHHAELLPMSYQRANIPKSMTFLDQKDQLISIPYQSYSVKLLLGWAMPITTQTTISVATETADESIALTIKDMESVTEKDIVNELIQWMKAYALNRSFTTQVKCRVLITKDISITDLDTRSWCKVLDPRIQLLPIAGPIVSYALSNEGGVTWADVTFMWAPEGVMKIDPEIGSSTVSGDPLESPKEPNQIVAWVKVLHDADEQYEYYQHHHTQPLEQFAAEFPMTQIEIGLHPPMNDTIEYIEKQYQI